MGKIFLRIYCCITSILLSGVVSAQDSLKNEKPQMADAFRSNGKIYVVVTVLVIILSGIFFYLYNLDRKIDRLEKKVQ